MPDVIARIQYDALNRLTYASGPFRSGSSNPLRYQYDALGNLKCLDASNVNNCQADGTQLTYPTPGATAVRPHAPTHINDQAVTHNAAGNLEAWGSRSCEYDNALGVLRKVKENGADVASMSYDASGRMGVLAEVASGETRYFVAEDFEWLKTSGLGRIQIRLAGTVIASDEATYPPPGGSCGALLPAADGDWRGTQQPEAPADGDPQRTGWSIGDVVGVP
jgi:YD repeat-containing protein